MIETMHVANSCSMAASLCRGNKEVLTYTHGPTRIHVFFGQRVLVSSLGVHQLHVFPPPFFVGLVCGVSAVSTAVRSVRL